ncbi:MAG: imidazolonepropionase [Bdellovibrionales bacterium]|nr:imidazolonepropionase [Bdellovibrionales bacterium]
MPKILIENLTRLHHFDHQGNIFKKDNVHILLGEDGTIDQISEKPIDATHAQIINGEQLLGLPAFVDCHSHTLFAGNRSKEFEMKCQGKSYLEIAKQGGGILSTQSATANATNNELKELVLQRVQHFMSQGVYGLEIKTGYGLTHDQEIRHLTILQELKAQLSTQFKIWVTYLGAHAVLPTTNKEKYIEEICSTTIPHIAKNNLADFVDTFVDDGFFDVSDLKLIHAACKKHNLFVKAHIDEIKNLGGADFAAKEKIVSVDHCRHTTHDQLSKLNASGVQVVFLPATSFYINEGFVTMRDIRDTGVKPAISLDYNPGSQPSLSWPLLLHLGMKKMGMTSDEVLYATTIAPLYALNEKTQNWCFEEGRKCKLTLFKASDISEIAYRYGENLCTKGVVSL